MGLDLLTANDRPGVHAASWYAESAAPLAEFPPLKGEETADVAVIGGGYTGLSAALHLAEAGLDVVLLEANRVGWGASGRNGGQVGSGQRQDQDWLERAVGLDRARALWGMAEDAKALVRDLVVRHAIPCDLVPGIVYAAHKPAYAPQYQAYAEKLARDYGYAQAEPLDRAGVAALIGTDAYHGGYLDRGAGHLHPLAYALGLARAAAAAGVRIHEGSRVEALGPRVRAAAGSVKAEFVILATNGYVGRLEPQVAARVMPINNFIVATEPLGKAAAEGLIRDNLAVVDSRFVVNYFRLTPDHRLLFGGGESYGWRFPADIEAVVRPRMLGIFPQLAGVRIEHAWGGTLAITVNRMPAFQRLAPNMFSAAGYSGHGVALATLAGRMMADAVRGEGRGFDLLATVPQPRFPGGAALRRPLLVLAMSWYALRDRL